MLLLRRDKRQLMTLLIQAIDILIMFNANRGSSLDSAGNVFFTTSSLKTVSLEICFIS